MASTKMASLTTVTYWAITWLWAQWWPPYSLWTTRHRWVSRGEERYLFSLFDICFPWTGCTLHFLLDHREPRNHLGQPRLVLCAGLLLQLCDRWTLRGLPDTGHQGSHLLDDHVDHCRHANGSCAGLQVLPARCVSQSIGQGTEATKLSLTLPCLNSSSLFLSLQIRQKSLKKLHSRVSSDVRRTPSSRRGRRSVRSGYAFAHQVSLIFPK